MTQKSLARQERDRKAKALEHAKKELKDNKCWDDLEAMYSQMCGLLASHAHIRAFAENKDLIACVADKQTLVQNIGILTRDLKTMTEELKQIHDLHADKKGGTQDPDELISTFSIFEAYQLFMERHQQVIMPTNYHIIEAFDQAEKVLNQKLAEAAQKLVDEAAGISDAEIITEPAAPAHAAGVAEQVQG